MELKVFLDHALDRAWWQQQSAVIFLSDVEYSILFFALLFDRLQGVIGVVRTLDLHDAEQQSVRMACESSFLGIKSYYWLKHLPALDAKRRSQWLDYVVHYQGPNCLIASADKLPRNSGDSITQITIEEFSTPVQVQRILQFLGIEDTKMRSFAAAELCKRSKKITLDMICSSARYLMVANDASDKSLPALFDAIIAPEKSLFLLSGHLLAQNSQAFLRGWSAIIYDFPELFWVSYWSDVLWRAYYFSQLMHAGNIVAAKQIAYKLPFSYIQRDWRKADLKRFKDAATALYAIDYELKNGSVSGYAALESVLLRVVNCGTSKLA